MFERHGLFILYDEPSFIAAWRDCCQLRGIDPLAGATSYQVVLRLGDILPFTGETWWADKALWRDPGRHHSSTEQAALANILKECHMPHERDSFASVLKDIFAELRAELHEAKGDVPLRDVLARQGKTLQYIELDAKTGMGIMVRVDKDV